MPTTSPDLPKLSKKEAAAVKAYLANGFDAPKAYVTAYPNAAKWKPETVEKHAQALFARRHIIAHIEAPTQAVTPAAEKAPKSPKKPAKPKGKAVAQTPKKEPGKRGPKTKLTDHRRRLISRYPRDFHKVHKHPIPTVAGLAMVLSVSRETVYAWSRHPEEGKISDTLDLLRTNQEATLVNGGVDGSFNSPITKLLLHKLGYHEVQAMEHTGRGGGPIETSTTAITGDMPPDEAMKIYLEMMEK